MTKEMAVVASEPPVLRLLGPMEVVAGPKRCRVGTGQEKCLAAALVRAEGDAVSHDELEEWIWDGRPKAVDPVDAIHKLASNVRKNLKSAGITGSLSTAGRSYRLDIAGEAVDVWRLRAAARRATELIAAGQDRAGAELLASALESCRGEPLAGLRGGRRVADYRQALAREVRMAQLLLSETEIKRGHYREQVGPLLDLLAKDPGNVHAGWLLMHASFRSKRMDQVREAQRRVNDYLRTENGVDESSLLRDLGRRMAEDDPALYQTTAIDFPDGAHAVTRLDQPNDAGENADERPSNSADTSAEDGSRSEQSAHPSLAGRDININLAGRDQHNYRADTMNFGNRQ